jgi:ATP-dependent Zn protease
MKTKEKKENLNDFNIYLDSNDIVYLSKQLEQSLSNANSRSRSILRINFPSNTNSLTKNMKNYNNNNNQPNIYDSSGAAVYLIVVILFYFLGILTIIACQIKRRKRNDYKLEKITLSISNDTKKKKLLGIQLIFSHFKINNLSNYIFFENNCPIRRCGAGLGKYIMKDQ